MKFYTDKMKTMQRFSLLSAAILGGIFFWILWSSRTLDSISGKTMHMDGHVQNQEKDISIHLHPAEKRMKGANFSNKASASTEHQLIDLPPDFNSINLKAWEISPEEGEEHIGFNEADYLQGERVVPTLTFKNREFFLNNMPFRIFSGALHYFRVLPEYWMDRLKKMKACGLNTVETYIAWNLHEPSPGKFDFSGMLNLRKFIIMAAELGLYVIVRPGPYICSEHEYGGLPGWLLSDPTMKVRTNHRGYIIRVNIYFSQVLPQLLDLQFGEGGPIIMFQVENEYLSYKGDENHVKLLYYMMRKYGVKELIVTSDHLFHLASEEQGFDMSKYALHTINKDSIKQGHIDHVKNLNQDFPVMVMELWSGWFDLWRTKSHQTGELATLVKFLAELMEQKYSFNIYMFHGGTNFGFTSGANDDQTYAAITTSYDYDAPLTEAGDTTPKYFAIRDQLLKFYKSIGISYLPDVPPNLPKAHYGSLKMKEILDWTSLLSTIPMQFQQKTLNYMENYSDRSGRQYIFGYIVYSHMLRPGTNWKRRPGPHFTGYVSGRLTAVLSGETFYVGTDQPSIEEDEFLWDEKMETGHFDTWAEYGMDYDDVMQEPHWLFAFGMKAKIVNVVCCVQSKGRTSHMVNTGYAPFWLPTAVSVAQDRKGQNRTSNLQLDLMVENQGRVNFFNSRSRKINNQRKGLKGQVLREVFGIQDEEWSIKFLHFDKQQCRSFSKSRAWMTMKAYGRLLEDMEQTQKIAPALYKTYLDIEGEPQDTFVRLKGWTKGIVIVNDFNLGRYWNVGPQETLYLPAPLLRQGRNEIMVFEEMSRGESITLQDKPILG